MKSIFFREVITVTPKIWTIRSLSHYQTTTHPSHLALLSLYCFFLRYFSVTHWDSHCFYALSGTNVSSYQESYFHFLLCIYFICACIQILLFRTTDQIILSNLEHMDGLNAIYMLCHSNEKYSRYKNDPLLFESILSNDVTMWRKGRGIKWKCIQYTWMSVRWCEWFYFIYFCHGEGTDFDVSGLLQVFLAVISSFCYYRCLFTIQRNVFLLN